jgi:hypothetical protein
MPYKLRKAPRRDLYWVVGESGRHLSKEPLPLDVAKRQLIAVNIALHRGGAVPVPAGTLQKMATESYKSSGQGVDGWELFYQTPTLKFYKQGSVIVLAVRGTKDFRDVRAWTPAFLAGLGNTARFKEDLAEIVKVQASYPPSSFEWYGVGHSLGGAIIDELIERGILREGLSYNPAVAAKNFGSDVKNERHYLQGDPLYALMGQHTKRSVVRGKKPSILKRLFTPLVYQAKNTLAAHALSNFEGGKSSR